MRRKNLFRLAVIAPIFAVFWLAPWPARYAQQSQMAQRDVGFERSVRPFLTEHCYGCHNADMKSGGLNLEAYSTVASILQSGQNGQNGEDRRHWEEVAKRI